MFTKMFIITFQKNVKILIAFEDMITDVISNQKVEPIAKEYFIHDRKLNFPLIFNAQWYFFSVPKSVSLNSTHYFIMKVLNKYELRLIALNYSPGMTFGNFLKIYRQNTIKPYSLLVNDNALPSDIPYSFWNNLVDIILQGKSFWPKIWKVVMKTDEKSYTQKVNILKYLHHHQVKLINMNSASAHFC